MCVFDHGVWIVVPFTFGCKFWFFHYVPGLSLACRSLCSCSLTFGLGCPLPRLFLKFTSLRRTNTEKTAHSIWSFCLAGRFLCVSNAFCVVFESSRMTIVRVPFTSGWVPNQALSSKKYFMLELVDLFLREWKESQLNSKAGAQIFGSRLSWPNPGSTPVCTERNEELRTVLIERRWLHRQVTINGASLGGAGCTVTVRCSWRFGCVFWSAH